MRVARSLEEAAAFEPVAVTIGNFDGVHAGHQLLLHEVTTAAREKGLQPAVLTFDPHPASIVAPQRAARLLTTQAERCSVLARHGIEYVLVLPFTREMARWTPEQFVERVLVKALRARVVIVGSNFRFGHDQAGDTTVLTQLGQRFGFETRVLTPVKRRARTVSSSEIRRAVESGNVALAARLLGRPYSTAGAVVPGHGIGSKQTVPTLNLRTHAQVLPATGVYITRTFDEESSRCWNSLTNIGYRPTFESTHPQLTIETFLLDPLAEPAPRQIHVEYLRRLREERKFESPPALKSQILRDVSRAQAFFRRLKQWTQSA
ncbi:MAG: bifunctional riboflavin kinase/FAD synthetase [Acidobacteriota bacterium]|nr:bifunctional riboflavin kinase/FAD synthetase [Acidobacteriota bacterium]